MSEQQYRDGYRQVFARKRPRTRHFLKSGFDSTNGTGHANKERTVDSDAKKVTHFLNLATGQSKRPKIPKYKMVVGTTGLELVITLDEVGGQGSCIGDDLTCVLFPLGLGNLEECRRDGGNCLEGRCITIR